MKYLLCRYGGIGDTIILTVVAKAIKNISPESEVHIAVRDEHVDLLEHISCIDKVLPIKRMMSGHIDCLETAYGWASIASLAHKYDMPIDYRYLIEGNTMHRHMASQVGEWMASQNSNYQNWIDLSLSWANIDPTQVTDKNPQYALLDEEVKWARKEVEGIQPIIAVNMTASSRSRTRINSHELIRPILQAFPSYSVIWWSNEERTWYKFNKNGLEPFSQKVTLRQSIALLAQCEVFVAMDSGLSHMADSISSAIGLKTICFYTTVPSWTRSQYFAHCHAVDADLPCAPCFNLHLYCPENRRKAIAGLSEREKKVMGARSGQLDPQALSKELGVSFDDLEKEVKVVEGHLNTLAAVEPECTKQITPDRIIAQLRQVLAAHPLTNREVA